MRTLRKIVGHVVSPELSNDELQKRARAAERRHAGVGDPDGRIEVGEVETSFGRIRFSHSVAKQLITMHGVEAPLSVIDQDLRRAISVSSAAFNAAQTGEEQSDQRAVIGVVVDAVLRRHDFLSARVKEARLRERYDN